MRKHAFHAIADFFDAKVKGGKVEKAAR